MARGSLRESDQTCLHLSDEGFLHLSVRIKAETATELFVEFLLSPHVSTDEIEEDDLMVRLRNARGLAEPTDRHPLETAEEGRSPIIHQRRGIRTRKPPTKSPRKPPGNPGGIY